MSQLFQFKSAVIPSIEYTGDDYTYIITNIAWTNIDIDTIKFDQLLDIVGKVNAGDLYALRRTKLFDALDVKLGTDVSGNFAPTIAGKVTDWDILNSEYVETDNVRIRKISVKDSSKKDAIQYDALNAELTVDLSSIGGNEGFVCIRDVRPTDTAENVYKSVTSSDELVVDECIATTSALTVSVMAITGALSLKPEWIKVNDQEVTMVQHTVENLWIGEIELADAGATIIAEHAEGATDQCLVTYLPRPIIQSVIFTGDYPAVGQTHYHYNQNVTIEITSNSVIFAAEILDVDGFDALQPRSYVAANDDFITNTVIQIAGKTEYSNDGQSTGKVWVRIQDQYGSWSEPFNSNAGNPNVDHVSVIKLDSDIPVITIDSIDYPGTTQQALKSVEQAEILYTHSNTESIEVDPVGVELTTSTPIIVPGSPIYVNRSSGGYNITTNNIRITGIKTSNNTSSFIEGCVFIANDTPTITLTGTHASTRLRSGGNNGTSVQNYQVAINSDQKLIGNPEVDPEPSAGAFVGAWVPNIANTVFTRNIQIHDSITRDEYTFTLSGVVNLAGLPTSVITSGANYKVGGFVSRSGTFADETAYVDIGVNASGLSNLTKLIVTIGGVSCTYTDDTNDVYYVFGANHIITMVSTGDPNVSLSTGNALRINEENTVEANSTGGLPYIIEELA